MADDRLIAEIAVRLKLLSREQLAQCLVAQQRAGAAKRDLATHAVELGLLNSEQAARILHHEQRILERRQGPAPASPPVAIPPVLAPPQPSARTAPEPAAQPLDLSFDTEDEPVESRVPSTASLATPLLEQSVPDLDIPGLTGSSVETETSRAGISEAPPTRPSLLPPPRASASHSRHGPPRSVVATRKLSDPALQEQTSGQIPYLLRAAKFAVDNRASDLHVHSGAPMMARAHGRLVPFRGTPLLDRDATEKIIAQILSDEQWGLLESEGEVDLAIKVRGLGRFRCNAYRQHGGVDMVLRIIPPKAPTLQSLGLPETLARLTDYRTGLVLCTGPTGCGKSTTLAALLNAVIHSRRDHVLTLEDPVEFVFEGGQAKVTQRQVGVHTESFARGLRAALREDPDVIAITELRDRETISLALTAAETGHLVLGTLHTSNATQTIGRLINAFAADEQAQVRNMFAESLRAIVSQRLVPRADGQGRVAAIELLIVNNAVTNLIREGKEFQLGSLMQTGKGEGMQTLDDSLLELIRCGVIDKQQAARFATQKERFG